MKQFVFFLLLLFSSSLMAQEKPLGTSVTKALFEQMDQNKNNELIRINIRLINQYDLQNLNEVLANLDRTARRAVVVSELKSFSDKTQKGILDFLETKSGQNKAHLIYSLWINNVITCLASNEVIADLSHRNDIDRIDWDESRKMIIDAEIIPEDEPENGKGITEITWNVTKVNVPAVWALGFTGAGIKVGVLDTGVNYNHVDLADHMWMDPSYPNHGYDFVNNDNNPMDDHGHGTHCAGTVAGDGTAGSQTGMAPEATIIALKVLDAGGSGTESGVWAAIQFIVDHGGDVISMSLGWQQAWGPDRLSWRNSFNNALAAGVISSVAAGNEGTTPGVPNNLRTPGDVPPPWLHPDQTLTGGISGVVSVGATDINDAIASFSSRGPVTWSTINPFNDYAYNPGMGLIRPDISAPGDNIKSLDYSSNTGYADGWSGTSMATPCVAGVMALMLNKNPNLTPAEIDYAIEMNALELGTAGKDNVYGSGRINALAAVNYVNYPGPVYNSHTITDPNSNGQVEAGENISLSIEMYNGSDIAVNNVVVTISSASPFVTITDNTENYGNFSIWQYKTIPNGFAFNVAANTPGMETIRINISATDGIDTWTSFFDIITYGPSIRLGNITISDPLGNNNGRLDPGETVDLIIAAENIGQVAISNVLVVISSTNGFITLNNLQVNIPNIAAAGSVSAVFNMTVDDAAPVGTNIDFHFDMTAGVYSNQKNAALTVGLIVEDWETGNFGKFPWAFGGSTNWTITNVGPYEGIYTAKSGTITHSQISDLTLDVEVISAGNISFFRKVSSEAGWDYLRFYVDGVLQGEWAGEVAWSEVIYPVSVGTHTFKWTYYKDTSVNSGSDCAWVDFIIFPPIAPPPAPADIDINPLSFSQSLPLNSSIDKQLTVSNLGEVDLNFTATVEYQASNKAVATVYPLNASYNTGTTTSSSKTQTSLVKGYPTTEAGWMKFDVSGIPVGATINSIEFHGYVNATNYPYWSITPVTNDPVTSSPSVLYSDISAEANSGYYLYRDEGSTYTTGWKTHILGGSANANLQVALTQNWFAIGIYDRDVSSTYYIGFHGWNEANKPYLVIDYTYVPPYAWLKVDGLNSTSGTVAGGNIQNITVSFNSTGLSLGTYNANIKITSNDIDEPLVTVPCTLNVVGQLYLDLTVMLEGPYNTTDLNTTLNSAGLLPLNQPYNSAPWIYSGIESVGTIPNANVVDWMLVELRDAANAASATSATRISRQAALLLKDGSLVALDGVSNLQFTATITQQLFVVIYHRNHVSVLSATGLTQTGGIYTYNFTTGSGQAYGGTLAHKLIGSVWCMFGGNSDGNGLVDSNDEDPVWQNQTGTKGYLKSDFNFDTQSNNKDKDDIWSPNLGKGNQVPN